MRDRPGVEEDVHRRVGWRRRVAPSSGACPDASLCAVERASSPGPGSVMVSRSQAEALAVEDLAIEHKSAQAAESFRFVLDVTPVNVEEQRREFLQGRTTEPVFVY